MPQGRPAGWPYYASLLLQVLVGIPGNFAPGTTSFSFEVTPVTKRKTTNARERARAVMPRRPCWRPSCHAAHAGGAALPFPCRFPGPVRLLCGRLPHTHEKPSALGRGTPKNGRLVYSGAGGAELLAWSRGLADAPSPPGHWQQTACGAHGNTEHRRHSTPPALEF